jgi:hypothetical protein
MIKRMMKSSLAKKSKQSPRCNHKSSQLDAKKKKKKENN